MLKMADDVEENKFEDDLDRKISATKIRLELGCKCLAWIIIIISALVHSYRLFQLEYGGQTCPLLFHSGHWSGNKWQPDGCMIHEYTQSEITKCFENQKVALIGDSRMRSLYFQIANSISKEPVPTGYHENLRYEDKNNATVEFYWNPVLDKTVTRLLNKWLENRDTMPHLIIMGVATWTIKNGKLTSIIDYQAELKKLSISMELISENLTQLNMLKPIKSKYHHEPQLIWIMQDPVVEDKLAERRKSIKNDRIEMFNYAAQKTLQSESPHVRLMMATTLMAAGKPEETLDGIHYTSFILEKKVNAIINSFCNDFIYPDDASCCKTLERITQLQFNAFAVLGTCVILWMIMWICKKMRERSIKDLTEDEVKQYDQISVLPWLYAEHMYAGMKAMAKLAAIMLYIFLADSSLLYNKNHKLYSHEAFFVPLALLIIVGLCTRTPTKQASFLNTHQVEEWKGWMIIVIMLYNYTHAEEVLPIFVNVRLLVYSFLFMIGFVHFKHFWYAADFGLYKICKVLAHMNVFCVVLCLVMGHPYQFYYIAPLLSFWFFIVYITMALLPRITHQIVVEQPRKNVWMISKLIILFVIVFVIWANENICEFVFSQRVIRELFIDSNGEIQKWRFHSGLHRYAVVVGMLCSYVYVTLKRNGIIKDDDSNGLILPSTKLSVIAVLFAFVGLLGFEIQAFTCHSKDLCDHTHSIAACIPILSYLLLRNIPGWLRSKYSFFFAWVGDMALELFLGQYHIWLANDTHGIHVLLPGYPTLNAVVTSFTFVCVIHEVKKICAILADTLVTKDVKIMLRRLLIFAIMLVVIWWHKSHEKKPGAY